MMRSWCRQDEPLTQVQGRESPPCGAAFSSAPQLTRRANKAMVRAMPRSQQADQGSRCGNSYEQPVSLNEAMRVLQLNVPLFLRYSLVNQKVQSSIGSTVMAL